MSYLQKNSNIAYQPQMRPSPLLQLRTTFTSHRVPEVILFLFSKIEIKYKINCPACTKKTVFYDLRHLILTKTNHEEEELFVTDKFINQKP